MGVRKSLLIWGEQMTLRDHLIRVAEQITGQAPAAVADPATFSRLQPSRRAQFHEMLGLDAVLPAASDLPLNVVVTGIVERPRYRIEKLTYESLPGLYVAANLYVPKSQAESSSPVSFQYPAILYVCGHSPTQKVHYQAHARRFAELGFVCLIVETIQYGERRGEHHGCYAHGWFHWYSRGYTPAGVETLNGIRGLDLLCQRSEVDATRLGVTGTSGGGATSWWITAADPRVCVTAPSCATATLHSHIADRTIDEHCDCMWWINTCRWDLADVGALIAPRPLLIASADRDAMNTIAAIRQIHAQLQPLYACLGAEANLGLQEGPGPHAYTPETRTAIFSWFARHLQGREIPPSDIGDVEETPERQESEETLRVFVNGPPPDDRTLTIQDAFIPLPDPPNIENEQALATVQANLIAVLREKTFGAFPEQAPPLDVQRAFEFAWRTCTGCRFSFVSEEDWRLYGRLIVPNATSRPSPVMVGLCSPDEANGAIEAFLSPLEGQWSRAIIETRGTGETAWGPGLQWHLRRAAAWTGRTIASMRVWDTLRALEAVRSLAEVEGRPVALAARGEMAAVALYAALLDGNISALILQSPPATQHAPSRPDGRGETIEMLNCLRFTDLAQVAGLLFPTELVFVGDCPATYGWAESFYHRLGARARFHRVSSLAEWKGESL